MREHVEQLAAGLLARGPERDDGFRHEIQRGSILSLRTVGALEIAVPLLMLAAGVGIIPVPITSAESALPNLVFIALGAVTLAAGWTEPGRRYARLITAVSIWISAAIIIWSALLLAADIAWVEHHLLGYMILVLFGAAAAVPLKPAHTLVLGLGINVLYLGSLLAARQRLGWAEAGYGSLQHVFTFGVTLLCTGLTASVYRQRYVGYLAHQEALRTSERLRQAESRLLISENAATMGRVAAALSHELNSPIGVLTSAVETLSQLADRMRSAPAAEQDRLRAVLADITRSGRDSAARLRGIVGRMQRFTNLDRADVQSANLNDLLSDVVAVVSSESRNRVPIDCELHPLPRFVCRPQQLSAVFSNLLSNAVDAIEADGRVFVATRDIDGAIEVRIEDNGRGIPAEDLPALFDPAAFRVSHGRVAAGNWSLFSCRQILREHGGDIEVTSGGGGGTTVRVTLPTASGTSDESTAAR
ncbi:MAG TPA: HAMP domain-containing sensor histidine kinase [Bryobacteraceae bacterium]|nr:HAMP domain-containing sensor histidine kinase [Bryobacteraceae bacterium]